MNRTEELLKTIIDQNETIIDLLKRVKDVSTSLEIERLTPLLEEDEVLTISQFGSVGVQKLK